MVRDAVLAIGLRSAISTILSAVVDQVNALARDKRCRPSACARLLAQGKDIVPIFLPSEARMVAIISFMVKSGCQRSHRCGATVSPEAGER